MPVHTLSQNQDLEERGKVKLELVGLRYTGNKSTMPVNKYQRQAGWPGSAPLQGGPIGPDGEREPGPIQLALVPDWTDDNVEDRTLLALENDPDVDVIYDRSEIAAALLERNYLPPEIFDRGYDARLRERVFDALGLEDVGARNVPGYREQLAEIAGLDTADMDDAEAIRDASRVGEYKREYPRGTLLEAATALGGDFDASANKTTLAEWLADQDAATVEAALDDPDSVEPVVEQPADDETEADVPADYDEWTVAEVKEWAADASDAALRAALEYEQTNADRTTATTALESALDGGEA